MANWRREHEGVGVLVVPEAATVALCQLEREKLGPTIWDTGIAAPDLCVACSRAMLAATTESIRLTETIGSNADLVLAKESLRRLLRVVPDGVTRDLIMYARACLARGDITGAQQSVRTWRANLRAIGVFGQDD